ncbi:MAG TPA: iron ABC transporter permease [Herpetosiphon sp.]|uniref:Binding-protein-dependent transport systems inner membrane component n=1 Tax=Herpetosiphon aurantiacus (strain ATCC 23779 / DSM 785 / 114-95) TaxID=316274 RepID=A9B3U5_HERA2|nr:iron ABC transporter permease [Herpetosiphon sp.]ABX06081.1 binding-protein-dependent transport systems inner membrane component [Herpetosiphon aurantiacus DSM 785]HBW48697.1 iron ABC transporter permease [Herpetosiphon sp.]
MSNTHQRRIQWLYWILALPALAFFVLFFGVPLWAIMQRAFAEKGLGAAIQMVFSNRSLLQVVAWSAWQATLSTMLTLLLGVPTAYILAHYRFPGRALLRSLIAVPFVLPTVVVALAFRALLGERGLINRWLVAWLELAQPPLELEQSLGMILIAHVFFNLTVVVRLLTAYWSNHDPRLEASAQVLGAPRWRVWLEVTLPLAMPALLAAALLVFTFTFSAFGTVLLLGSSQQRTIEVEIYDQAIHQFNLPIAATLSLLQILTSLGLTLAYTRLVRRSSVPQEAQALSLRRARTWPSRVAIGGVMLLASSLIVLPLASLVLGALRIEGQWSLEYFRMLGINQRGSYAYVPPTQAMLNSLRYAGITTILALVFGLPCAYLLAQPQGRLTRLLDGVLMLPLGTSAVTVGLGYIIAFRSYEFWGWETPDLRRWSGLLPLAHTLLALPFVIRTMVPALRRLNPQLREAARMLGAKPWQAWREVDLGLLLPSIMAAGLFAFTVSLGDFGAALVVSVTSPATATMPVVIFRFLGQPGASNYGQALAMSSLLMGVTFISFLLLERFRDQTSEW